MPNYALHCPQASCLHRWQTFAHMKDRHTLACPKCGRIDPDTDFEVLKASGGVKFKRPWENEIGDGKSLQLSFDPRGIKQLKKEVPSIELDRHGDVVFRSDGHQRRVYAEVAGTQKRCAEESEARLNRRRATSEDVSEAAGAIRQFINIKAREGYQPPRPIGPTNTPGKPGRKQHARTKQGAL